MGKAKLNIPMFAALILLLLTMITTHMTSGLYARYTASATGSDSVRVAKFEVTCDVERVAGTDTYILTVQNNSEVTVKYSVQVTLDPHLSAKLDGVEPVDGLFENADWQLLPEAEPVEHTLALAVTNWNGLTTSDEPQATEPVSLSFSVNVIAEQVD